MKLHLGCGLIKRKGYLNCDISKEVNPDKIVDLEKPLPFKDNSVDEIVAEHVLEHVNNLIPLFSEFYRICKNNAIINIRVPYFSHESAFSTMAHVRFFTYTSFDMLDKNNKCHWQGVGNFKTIYKKLAWYPNWFSFFNLFPRLYQKLFPWIFPAKELYVKLKVIK